MPPRVTRIASKINPRQTWSALCCNKLAPGKIARFGSLSEHVSTRHTPYKKLGGTVSFETKQEKKMEIDLHNRVPSTLNSTLPGIILR